LLIIGQLVVNLNSATLADVLVLQIYGDLRSCSLVQKASPKHHK